VLGTQVQKACSEGWRGLALQVMPAVPQGEAGPEEEPRDSAGLGASDAFSTFLHQGFLFLLSL
jgi:hypothetical protein